MSSKRSYALTLAALIAAGVGILLGVGRTWATVRLGGQGVPVVVAELSGRTLAPLAAGAGILVLAGVAGIAATRTVGRGISGGIVALSGVAASWSAIAFAVGASAAATAAGRAELGADPEVVATNRWWLLVVAGGFVALAAGMVTIWLGRSWPAMGSRYERTAGGSDQRASAGNTTPAQAWDALDRGVDPTIDSDLTQ